MLQAAATRVRASKNAQPAWAIAACPGRIRETNVRNGSIGAWRERTRIGVGLSIFAAAAALQFVQWLHSVVY
jgi:hypothetical protein